MPPIQFGILLIPFQTLDVAGPTDILSSTSKPYLEAFTKAGLFTQYYTSPTSPAYLSIPARAIDIEFHHIAETLSPVPLTSGFRVLPTTTCDDAPDLDYLLIGGPDPATYTLSERFAEYVKEHVKKGKGVFTTCTGGLIIAPTGVLDGVKATTNHVCLEMARALRPQVEWVGEQWVVDGRGGQFWTAGGACAGMDMFAQWVKERYDADIVRLGLESLDFRPRGLDGKAVVHEWEV
ncbi:Class I glutamine amidotransferase-like protein [Glarea lozoyensis ATCC 20868]|uniref:Class I glutamine amidotransferase-like protein n=2 Tax=Glarea lozoyensis TaxID=101852 RepID=S3D311_GLAL2|nr:Class I glutamine amidotransferase-like protein [Glarea lozoyensis ATCC 20868]EHK97023.1 putative Intracellular protease 1 [Glarea lozoyensis 74030]EPE32195.1 Class I glutamine amidotransferase-like protein [Glarea lozoyensis ATCC 20868]